MASAALRTTNYFYPTRLRTRTGHAALNSNRCEGWLSAQASLSAIVHDATERWELYRWLSNGMRLYYGLLRREP